MKKITYKKKNYIHFDRIKSIEESRKWIENPENIIHHSFMPFIHFKQKTIKYTSPKGRKPKYRDLSYCAHIDAYIYQLYAHKLTKLYNEKAKRLFSIYPKPTIFAIIEQKRRLRVYENSIPKRYNTEAI